RRKTNSGSQALLLTLEVMNFQPLLVRSILSHDQSVNENGSSLVLNRLLLTNVHLYVINQLILSCLALLLFLLCVVSIELNIYYLPNQIKYPHTTDDLDHLRMFVDVHDPLPLFPSHNKDSIFSLENQVESLFVVLYFSTHSK